MANDNGINDIKDIILATLDEIENDVAIEENIQKEIPRSTDSIKKSSSIHIIKPTINNKKDIKPTIIEEDIDNELKLSTTLNKLEENIDDESGFLLGMRERLLVLFEGLKSNKNQNIDKKLNITLSYLQYTLALLDERLEYKNKNL
jgi:hypothetical protein